MNLFQIDQSVENFLLQNLDEETGEIQNLELLDELNLVRDQKVENIAKAFLNAQSDAKELKEREKVFSQRRKSKEKEAERLELYLALALDGEKFETADVKCSFRKSKVLEVANEERVPKKFFKVTKTISKSAIKDFIQTGGKVRGCSIQERLTLTVK